MDDYGADWVKLGLAAPTGGGTVSDYDILYLPADCGAGATPFTL